MRLKLHVAGLTAAVLVAFTMQGALAADASPGAKPASSAPRQQIQKEGTAAHNDGTMPHGEAAKSEAPKPKSTRSRDVVQKEGTRAHNDGTMPHGEAAESEAPKPASSGRK